MSEQLKFKDYYDAKLALLLAEQIEAVYADFDSHNFVEFVRQRVEPLELKARVAMIAEGLQHYLPTNYPTAVQILLGILGDELTEAAGMFDAGYHLMPVAYFVEVYGLEHPAVSLNAIYEITKRFTSEFAIRPYLQRYPEQALAVVRQWAQDPNPHVRRLVSEGTRTRLPWGARLTQFIENPYPVLELLTLLRDDDSAYVRKSVANSLNDLSKDHPELVISTLKEWLQTPTSKRTWVARHGLRTLIKAGHRDALNLLGYGPPHFSTCRLTVTPESIHLGESITLNVELTSEAPFNQPLMIDYVVHFARPNSKTSPKVFKWKSIELAANGALHLEKAHTIKPVTVRRYYSGEHRVDLQINGECVTRTSFILTV